MIEVFDVAGNVIGFRMNGSISNEEFDEIVAKTEAKIASLAEGQGLRVYAEIEKLGLITPEKFVENLKFKFKNFKHFEKEAIVSDKQWLNTFINVFEKLFPSIEAKTFSFEEKEKALEWIKNS